MSNLSERLLEERKRLGLNQTDFGAMGGVSKWTQLNYEKGENVPDGDYFVRIAAGGADILFIFTGNHASPSTLTLDEAELLNSYRLIGLEEQRVALRALMLTMAINKK